jgi:hypothetical protein
MNRFLSFFGALALLALGACDGLTAPDAAGGATAEPASFLYVPPESPEPLRFRIGIGQTRSFGESASALTFNDVLSDTRCPVGSECPQAGEARTRFTFRRGDGSLYTVQLGIPGGSPRAFLPEQVEPALAGGYFFRLVRLQPYPGYAPEAGMPVTATLVVEPCPDRCFEVYPRPGHP